MTDNNSIFKIRDSSNSSSLICANEITNISVACDGSFLLWTHYKIFAKVDMANPRSIEKVQKFRYKINFFELSPNKEEKETFVFIQNYETVFKRSLVKQRDNYDFPLEGKLRNPIIQFQKSLNRFCINTDEKIMIRSNKNEPSIDDYGILAMKFFNYISNVEQHYLITGYKDHIKIRSFDSPPDFKEIYRTENMKFEVNIIETMWENQIEGTFWLIGNKEIKKLFLYEFKNNALKKAELKMKEEIVINKEDKGAIWGVKCFSKAGIGVNTSKHLYIYYMDYQKIHYLQCIDFSYDITHWRFCEYKSKQYFIITWGKHLKIQEFTFEDSNFEPVKSSDKKWRESNKNKINELRRRINLENEKQKPISKSPNPRKENEKDKERENYVENITIEEFGQYEGFFIKFNSSDLAFKVTINNFEPSLTIKLITKISNDFASIIENKISLVNSNYDRLFDFIKTLPETISNYRKRNLSDPQKQIVPYMKTCGFTWNKQGKIVFYQYNKIDYKELESDAKNISIDNSWERWKKFCLNKDEKTKYLSNWNKFIDDNTKPDMSIIATPWREWTQFNFSYDNNIKVFVDFVNSSTSLPAFTYYETDTLQECNNITDSQWGKIIIKDVGNTETQMEILKSINICLSDHEKFYPSIWDLLNKRGDAEANMILDLLNMIDYNINKLWKEENEILIDLYIKNIFTLIQSLELKKKYEYWFICVIVLTSRVFKDLAEFSNINTQNDKEQNYRNFLSYSKNDWLNYPKYIRKCSGEMRGTESRNNSTSYQLKNDSYYNIIPSTKKVSMDNIVATWNNEEDLSEEKICEEGIMFNEGQPSYSGWNNEYENKGKFGSNQSINWTISESSADNLRFNRNNHDNNINNRSVYIEQKMSIENDYIESKNMILIFNRTILRLLLDYIYYFEKHFYTIGNEAQSSEILEFLELIAKASKVEEEK